MSTRPSTWLFFFRRCPLGSHPACKNHRLRIVLTATQLRGNKAGMKAEPNTREIVESIPTSVLLRDAEASRFEDPEQRGFEISKVLRRGALVCLAATLPVFELRSHEANSYSARYDQGVEESISKPKHPLPLSPPPDMDMSTLQDAVSGLGFILDPPPPDSFVEPPHSLKLAVDAQSPVSVNFSGIHPSVRTL